MIGKLLVVGHRIGATLHSASAATIYDPLKEG
jgi:hypothetical protein